MELKSVKLNKFKRFESAELKTNGKLIALIGANESGKTSILEAIQCLDDDKAFSDVFFTRDLSEPEQDEVIIEATYMLSEEDNESILFYDPLRVAKKFLILKRANGKRNFKIEPDIIFNDQYRKEIINKTLQFIENIFYEDQDFDNELLNNIVTEGREIILQLQTSLNDKRNKDRHNGEKWQVPHEVPNVLVMEDQKKLELWIELIEEFLDFNQGTNNEKHLKELSDSAKKLLKYENSSLINGSIEIIYKRRPKALLFDDESRKIPSFFSIITQNTNKEKIVAKPDKALANLLKLAKLDLNELFKSLGNLQKSQMLLNRANQTIVDFFNSKWSQSNSQYLKLYLHGNTLRISIETNKGSSFNIDERSQGFRQFVALTCFLEVEHLDVLPILLIDEAELHLHYDAQVDLMKVLEKQSIAKKVIYTTHSIGCLPEDLGVGIKLVETQREQLERSIIENNFWIKWKKKELGMTPILFGLGAAQMSYIAIRPALFGEGISEVIILPTIFRQIIKKENLGFQIIGGLSETNQYALLDGQAPKVVYVTDYDRAGDEFKKKVRREWHKSRIYQATTRRWQRISFRRFYLSWSLYSCS